MIIALMGLIINNASSQTFTSGLETWTSVAPIKPTDWFGSKTSIVGDSIFQFTTSVHGGTYACQLKSSTTSHKRFTTVGVPIIAGKTYQISFWVRGHGDIRTGCYKGLGSNGATYYAYNPYIILDTLGWKHCIQSITVDTTSASAQFIISVRNTRVDKGYIQVDDVNIDTVSVAPVSIHDIQYATTAPYISPYNGQNVITGGIVTGRANKGFFIQNASGPWNGLYVYDSAHAATAGLVRGDSIIIAGTVSEYLTYTELGNVTNLTKVSSGNALHAAYPVTTVNATTESLEGVLVSLTNMPCVDASGSAAYGEWIVYNGTDSTKTGGLLYKYTTAIVGTHYDITGIVYLAYGGVMRVEPRDINDVQVSSGIAKNEQNLVNMYPNPTSSILNIGNIEGIQQIRITNLLGKTIAVHAVSGNNSSIDVSTYTSGVYFVSFIKDNAISGTRKFIKQ